MTPGELDQLITFRRQVRTDDGMGGSAVEWQDVATDVWAKARPLSGTEQERYDQLNATAMVTFVIRYRDDILSSDQIVWDGVEHNIRYISPVSSRSMYRTIEAERGVAQ